MTLDSGESFPVVVECYEGPFMACPDVVGRKKVSYGNEQIHSLERGDRERTRLSLIKRGQ